MSVRKLVAIAVLLVMVLTVVLACAQPAPAPAPTPTPAPEPAKTFELNLAHWLPPMHQQHNKVFELYAAEMEKRTNGRVKVKIFPSEQLGKGPEMYDIVLKGTADIAMVNPSIMAGRFPLDEIFHLPFFIPGDTGDPVGGPIRIALYEKYITPMHFKDVKMLWTGRFGLNVFHMVKKPVRKLEDMKGLVIGVPGGRNVTRLVQLTGAAAESSPVTDMFSNLEKGTIDGQTIPIEAMVAFKLSELVKSVTLANIAGSTFFIAMNAETWKSLPPDIQAIVDELSPWANKIQSQAWAGATAFSTKTAKDKSIELIKFSPEERARWVELAKTMDAEWIKTMDDQGMPGSEMYEEAKKMMAK